MRSMRAATVAQRYRMLVVCVLVVGIQPGAVSQVPNHDQTQLATPAANSKQERKIDSRLQKAENAQMEAEVKLKEAQKQKKEAERQRQEAEARRSSVEKELAASKRKLQQKAQAPRKDNGISVGAPKAFDNRSLTLMLETLQENLRGMQVIDQKSVIANLALMQGYSAEDVARSFSIMAGGTPGLVTNTASSTEDNLKTTAEGTASLTKGELTASIKKTIEDTLNAKNSQSQQTTVAPRAPAAPALPDLMTPPSFTPNFGQSAGDVLSDQVNLTYQIFNIRMVLERSLTDRLQVDKPKLNAVLGFNVSLDPPRDAEGAAAMVEVTVTAKNGTAPVSLVALMPQEKTYNSAHLSTKSNAFGGSAVVKMISVGYSERRRSQVFYLYRDNDTLSYERMDRKDHEVKFGWEFRPVLGRKSVVPGMRQMFAVIALPETNSAADTEPDPQLTVGVRTYWRKHYDNRLTTSDRSNIGPWPYIGRAATLFVREGVPPREIVDLEYPAVSIPRTKTYEANLQPKVSAVWWSQADEQTALVSVTGENFFSGTIATVGGTTHSVDKGLVIKSDQAMDIFTPLAGIGVGEGSVIGRYGSAQPLRSKLNSAVSLIPKGASIGGLTGGRRPISIEVCDRNNKPLSARDLPTITRPGQPDIAVKPIMLIDQKRISSPVEIQELNDGSIRFTAFAPEALAAKIEGLVTLTFPFQGDAWTVSFHQYDPDSVYGIRRVGDKTRALLVIKAADGTKFEDKGKWAVRLGDLEISVKQPGEVQSDVNSSAGATNSKPPASLTIHNQGGELLLDIETSILEQSKRLMLTTKDDNLIPLDIPPGEPKPQAELAFQGASEPEVRKNDQSALRLEGTKTADVAHVVVAGVELKKDYDTQKKVLTVFLTTEQTKVAAVLTLQFRNGSDALISTLDVHVKDSDERSAGKGKQEKNAKTEVKLNGK